jgi:hypothetical protein
MYFVGFGIVMIDGNGFRLKLKIRLQIFVNLRRLNFLLKRIESFWKQY